ncbi:MAG: ferritin [Rhodothermales bacterium]|jgi:ferritin
MKQKIIDAVNRQIREELQSSYAYLAMSARFEERKLPGAANWMRTQAREEVIHAMKFFDFLIRRGATPDLQTLEAPVVQFDSILEAFGQALEAEQHITKCIHELYDLAQTERDYPLQTLLHWFIDEQVEEEEAAEGIIDSIRLAGESGEAMFMIDRELGLRQPEPAA